MLKEKTNQILALGTTSTTVSAWAALWGRGALVRRTEQSAACFRAYQPPSASTSAGWGEKEKLRKKKVENKKDAHALTCSPSAGADNLPGRCHWILRPLRALPSFSLRSFKGKTKTKQTKTKTKQRKPQNPTKSPQVSRYCVLTNQHALSDHGRRMEWAPPPQLGPR